jgi:hypothetical protein
MKHTLDKAASPSRWLIGAGLLVWALHGAALHAGDKLEYNRDIRPILADNCFACHGPDKAARKGDLRLDQREAAVESGAIVPGKPDESELIARIVSNKSGHMMPPKKSKKTLTTQEKERLEQWVLAGAEYQKHWSFIPPTRPALAAVKNRAWVRNPIDYFTLAKMEQAGLQPAPEADRRTLARRLSLDLIGLPPEPAEVERFVNDKAPDAYERYVDRLMRSPHWGEHRGRYWLDVARYADTHGIHFDNYREIWAYRNRVIDAFNRNQPFDQFTIEQLAGDLLPGATLEQKVASGFNRCNITTNEGGTIPEEYLVLYTRDRTETTSQTWLGLTAGCAVCHDHKFDPLTQREFYEMAAFFNNTTQQAMDGNVKDTPPTMMVPSPGDKARWNALPGAIAAAKKKVEERKQTARADFDHWLAQGGPEKLTGLVPSQGLLLHAPLNDGDGKDVQITLNGKKMPAPVANNLAWGQGHVAPVAFKSQAHTTLAIPQACDFEKDQAFAYGAWVRFPANMPSGAIFARMDEAQAYRGWDLWAENGKVGAHIIHSWPGDALKVVSRDPVKPDTWNHLFVTYDGSGKAAGVKVYVNGTEQPTEVQADALRNTIRTQVPLKVSQRNKESRLQDILLQDLRIFARPFSAADVQNLFQGTRLAWLARRPADKRTPAETNELLDWWLNRQDGSYQELMRQVSALEQEQNAIKARSTVAHVMQEKAEMPGAFVLFRGEYDKRRAAVKPSTPRILPPMPKDLPRNRLGFANWLLQPDHPMTARVTVNRFWQEVFGTGIVRTAGDFGISGELPSHPELLDWMAVDFRESGWDVKKFFRLLVTSATYRQSAQTTEEKLAKDGQNRLLSRGPRFRMDAEMVRDYALAASDLLVRKVGGPSVKPYQPEGVWEAVAMIGSDTRDYRRDGGSNLYRRSMYTFWKRSAPPASMDIFNAPSREVCTVRRERTNTPLQALVTLNDPQYVEAARHLAQNTLKQGGKTFVGRIDLLSARLLARSFGAEEKQVVQKSLEDLLAFYQAHPEDARKLLEVGESKADTTLDASTLAAWAMLANQLMNLDEVLNK